MNLDDVSLRGEWMLSARRMNLGEATETVLREAAASGYVCAATGPNSFRLARTRRARLAKRTESVDVAVTELRDGVKVRVEGTVWAPFLAVLNSRLYHDGAIAGSGFSGAVVSTFAPQHSVGPDGSWTPPPLVPGSAEPLDVDRTVARGGLAAPMPFDPDRITWFLRFATGELLELGVGALIGRDPQDDPALPGAQRIRFDDLSLSRTHLSVGAAGRTVWVQDRHSTNGVSIAIGSSPPSPCPPGKPVMVPTGARVVFGDRHFVVEMG
jgi:hypothetical protein